MGMARISLTLFCVKLMVGLRPIVWNEKKRRFVILHGKHDATFFCQSPQTVSSDRLEKTEVIWLDRDWP